MPGKPRVSELKSFRKIFAKDYAGVYIHSPSLWGNFPEAKYSTPDQMTNPEKFHSDEQLVLFAEEEATQGVEKETQSTLSTEDKKSLFSKMTELREERMVICRACENFRSLLRQCSICRCIMPIKASFEGYHCPIEKW